MLDQLSAAARQLEARCPQLRTSFAEVLQFPGVNGGRNHDAQALQATALAVLDEALEQFVAAREREGAKLAAVIGERVDAIARIAAEVRELMPLIGAGQRLKLEARLADLPHPVEPGRMEQELVLWLQKLDVDEELDRLDSHITEIRRVLAQREPVGRRLDFLLQEFNREANTLRSTSVADRPPAAANSVQVLVNR